MKFQKTLLAAALAVACFSAQAAVVEKKGLVDAFKYQNADKQGLIKVNVISGEQSLIKSGWYTEVVNPDTGLKELKAYEGETSGFTTLVSGGQLAITTKESTKTQTETTIGLIPGQTATNVDQNNYWVFDDAKTETTTTITTDESSYEVSGQFVNYDENGRITTEESTVDYFQVLAPQETKVTDTKASTVKKDVQIGNLTEEETTAFAKNAFVLDRSATHANTQGLVATIKTSEQVNTAVAGVTGNGLAVLDVPVGALVNLEKGTVSSTQTTGPLTRSPRTELYAYDTVDGQRVVSYGSDYYTLDAKKEILTTFTGDLSTLKQVGAGTAEETSGGTVIKSVNTGLVSNKNVTYGESVTTTTQEGSVFVASTDASLANSTSGTRYAINPSAETVTSKDVVTGIIATDAEGNKTYGLQATNVVDNVTTAQTTVTAEKVEITGLEGSKTTINAEGISTTGVINAADFQIGGVSIVQNIQTSVGEATQEVVAQVETQLAANQTFVTEAVAAVDAGLTAAATDRQAIRAAAVEGDAATLASANAYTDNAVAGFNSRVGQLNSRIDDVEKTSYRGIAIALATQQQIPNIGAGQYAVFGGVGHYEGESAAALGVASVLADGRTSLSAALGFGGSEVGGRVGVSYVFGGK